MAVSSRRQRGHTKRTSCGDEDQLERLTLAAIGHASQCEHDTRNQAPGSAAAQCAPLRVHDVVQVTVLPWSHALQAATHWFMSRGL